MLPRKDRFDAWRTELEAVQVCAPQLASPDPELPGPHGCFLQPPAGLEPATTCSEGRQSIQFS